MSRIVYPTSDLAFKKLFSSEDHPNIIQGFLADVLGIKVETKDIKFKNPYSIDSYEKAKATEQTKLGTDIGQGSEFRETIKDVSVAIIDLADFTIEMQIQNHLHFLKRVHYYLDGTYTSNYYPFATNTGQRFGTLKPVIGFNIIGFNLFDDNRAFHMFSYRDDQTGNQLLPVLKRIGFLELGKNVESPSVKEWISFLTTGQAAPSAPPAIQEAATLIAYHNLSTREKAMIDQEEKVRAVSAAILEYQLAEQDKISHARGLSEGHATGRAEGNTEGRTAERLEMARNALAQGLDPDMVSRITGLELTELERLTQH